MRFYKHEPDGYYTFRVGERWLYWYRGRLRFSAYANSIDKFGK